MACLVLAPLALLVNIVALCLKQPLKFAVPGLVLSAIPVALIVLQIVAMVAITFCR